MSLNTENAQSMAAYTTINKPGLHFNTVLYTGNGSTNDLLLVLDFNLILFGKKNEIVQDMSNRFC